MKLSKVAIDEALDYLNGWTVNEDKNAINCQLQFKTFNEAFTFMTAVALKAEQQNHHPDWSNVYNKVNIQLSTHSEDGITEKDITLATFINSLL